MFGPYFDGLPNNRDAESETVALLYPALEEQAQEALLKSDCYWAASRELFTVAWEAVMRVCRPSLALTPASPGLFGACRLTHPQTGVPIQVNTKDRPDIRGCLSVGSAMAISFPPGVPGPFETSLNLPKSAAANVVLPRDLYAYATTFSVKPAPSDDRFGRCPGPGGFPTTPGAATLTGACAPSGGFHSACVSGCPLLPSADSTFQLSLGSANLVLRPTIRLVDNTGRKIARPMTREGSHYEWQTGIQGRGCGSDEAKRFYECSWEENFSPQVQVENVRIFALTSDDEEVSIHPTSSLRVVQPDPIATTEETWACAFRSGSAEASISGQESGCDDALVATPTYSLNAFALAVADATRVATPMTLPLHWSVDLDPASVPSNADVFIEFTLRDKSGTGALTVTPYADFGRLRTGRVRGERLRLRSVGSQPIQINRIGLTGQHASDFSFRVLENVQPPLRIPLDVTIDGNNISAKAKETGTWNTLVRVSEGPTGHTFSLLTRDDVSLSNLNALDASPRSSRPVTLREGGGLSRSPPAVNEAARPPRSTIDSPFGPTIEAANAPLVIANTENLMVTRLLPFTLEPGEEAEVFVEVTPSDYGDRQAFLTIDGEQLTRPDRKWQVSSSLHVFALEGPRFVVFPEGTLEFPAPVRPRSPERVVFLDNYGDQEGIRTDIAIVGPDASQFELRSEHGPARNIPPGDGEMFLLSLTHPCSPVTHSAAAGLSAPWRAELRVGTSEQTISIPLAGRPLQCLHNLNP